MVVVVRNCSVVVTEEVWVVTFVGLPMVGFACLGRRGCAGDGGVTGIGHLHFGAAINILIPLFSHLCIQPTSHITANYQWGMVLSVIISTAVRGIWFYFGIGLSDCSVLARLRRKKHCSLLSLGTCIS